MASAIVLNSTGGPGKSDIFDSCKNGNHVFFVHQPETGKMVQQVWATVNGIRHVERRMRWLLSGVMEIRGVKIGFKNVLYNTSNRREPITVYSDEVDIFPECGHIVPKLENVCHVCGQRRCE